jgi:exosortase J
VIGSAFPAVSFLGVISVWRRLGWDFRGTFWGLLPLAVAVQLVHSINVAPYYDVFQAGYWREPHPGPVLFLYAVGATLLFGGWPLLRAAMLPLCLLLCVNPVPRAFNLYMDLPLQELSAGTARAFAHLIGLHPTGEQLRMMFSPDFGMLIVPGCNGVRGSITFAYLALIYGYTRRLRLSRLFAVSGAALLAGYAMNLLRLCVLVLYYRAGLSWAAIKPYGAGVDYVIGCTVFLTGTVGLGFLIRALEPAEEMAVVVTGPEAVAGRRAARMFVLRSVCFAMVAVVGIVRAHAMFSPALWRHASATQIAGSLPTSVGPYKLIRSYTEQQYYVTGGAPNLILGEYEAPAVADRPAVRMTLGLYVAGGYHRLIDSMITRGLRPVQTGTMESVSAGGKAVSLGTSEYDTGDARQFNAETICAEGGCENPVGAYGRLSRSNDTTASAGNHLPILLREEWPEGDATPAAVLSGRFEQDAREFLCGLDVQALVARVGRPVH